MDYDGPATEGKLIMDASRPSGFELVRRFAEGIEFARIPPEVRHFASLLLLDTIGVAAAARELEAARISRNFAAAAFAAGPGAPAARMMFDGRAVSPAGAAFAAAAQIDNLDGHDGYNPTKGHIGVVAIPALLTFAQVAPAISGAEAITTLVLGYEIGARAGIALHGTVSDYHTSGAWNALAVAAIGARLLKLSPDKLREALGIAEYHGPRSQMMRVIDTPTMLHDGSAWGALAGVTAVYLADQGFTGAPAVTVEAAEVDHIWRDLGESWVVHRHYIKPYPVCRWTHALIDCALQLRREHGLAGADIAGVELTSFHEATRLYREVPATSPVAQYSISYPVAAALVRGRVGVEEIEGPGLADPEAARLVAATHVHESAAYNARFPADRWGEVTVILKDGRRLASGPRNARGGPENPIGEDEIVAKFRDYAGAALGQSHARAIEDAVRRLAEPGAPFAPLIDLTCRG
jgi:2-methylcitrate dehydratase PrpD